MSPWGNGCGPSSFREFHSSEWRTVTGVVWSVCVVNSPPGSSVFLSKMLGCPSGTVTPHSLAVPSLPLQPGQQLPPQAPQHCWLLDLFRAEHSLVPCYCNRECWMDFPALLSGPGLPVVMVQATTRAWAWSRTCLLWSCLELAVSGTGHLLLPRSTLLPPATKTLAINAQCTSSRSSYLCWDFTL